MLNLVIDIYLLFVNWNLEFHLKEVPKLNCRNTRKHLINLSEEIQFPKKQKDILHFGKKQIKIRKSFLKYFETKSRNITFPDPEPSGRDHSDTIII